MVRKCRKAQGTVGTSSTYMQLRSRRIFYRSEKANNNGVSSSSCCESNNNRVIDLEEERDGEAETSSCRLSSKRKLFENLREKESMENSQQIVAGFDSALKESSDCCSSRRRTLSTTEVKEKPRTEQPTAEEIEDFFVEAEKQLHDKFKKKYNFDFEKEKPLEGRYEWVKLSE
ncbi:unnamed protein product [Eruca vesicaria subsp. sativa]|uniref:Cyclin-dependent kinase inhibitor domain-containing protein n=1 Tax=Eruca vesicaria subsp. sativa TaxID=29727 RepID=A0ABC8L5P9_ERUVS|nr:unnamed protein product [Eruca vesicaria subsp. sativa]